MKNMNKYYVLITAFLSATVIFATVSYANTECKPHYKNFDENTLMGILTMLDKAKTSNKEKVINNGHAMVARKTGECTVDLELYDDTNETQLLCRESLPACLSEDNKDISSEEAKATRTHFENEKIRAKKYLDVLEMGGREQMKEKERRVKEYLKVNPQVETSENYYVNKNGDHELIVTFIDNADEKSIKNDMEKENANFISTMERKDAITKLISVTTTNSKKLFERLKNNPNVKSIEFNGVGKLDSYVVPSPNDPFYSSGWHLSQISAPAAWQISVGSSDGPGVAVIDTGVNVNHEDLASSIWYSDGYSSDHGSFGIGVIAASGNNGVGVTGINWYGRIYSYSVPLVNDVPDIYSLTNELYRASNNPDVRIINMSWHYPNPSTGLSAAIKNAYDHGKVLIAAAGNKTSDTDNPLQVNYPASDPYVMSVSGTNKTDNRVPDSYYGPFVDVSAPGESIYSTSLVSYNYFTGTSVAAPMVSGLASLVLTVHPSLTNYQVYNIIQSNTDAIPVSNYMAQSAYGRINAYKALQAALVGVTRDFDINGDGLLTIADALKTLRKVVGLVPITQSDLAHGDVAPHNNGVPVGNGILDVSDALVSLYKVTGLI